jgi:hypothetical protein
MKRKLPRETLSSRPRNYHFRHLSQLYPEMSQELNLYLESNICLKIHLLVQLEATLLHMPGAE